MTVSLERQLGDVQDDGSIMKSDDDAESDVWSQEEK